MKTRLDKAITNYVGKSFNTHDVAMWPIPIYKAQLTDMEVWEYTWKKAIEALIGPTNKKGTEDL